MTISRVSTHHVNGQATGSTHHDEPQDWKQEHPKYIGWRMHEPPFLHSVKWHDPESGNEHLTVIRADDLDSLFVQVRTVTHMVKICRQKAHDAPQAQATPEGWFTLHNAQMTPSKDGNGFYHKAGEKVDGKAIWCRGR